MINAESTTFVTRRRIFQLAERPVWTIKRFGTMATFLPLRCPPCAVNSPPSFRLMTVWARVAPVCVLELT